VARLLAVLLTGVLAVTLMPARGDEGCNSDVDLGDLMREGRQEKIALAEELGFSPEPSCLP